MARDSIKILVQGLDQMLRDFEQLASPEPYERANEELNNALRLGFEGTQHAVPVGTGDYRRPAGALRDSGRYTSEFNGDEWTGEVTYGTDDDALPYAAWARYKNLNKGQGDYLGDPMDDVTPDFDRAVDAPWREVFGDGA